jgi:2-polyprenyl-3-methyl-5-hydroxy-6-metoxy-1,4-benzoquinol methylase
MSMPARLAEAPHEADEGQRFAFGENWRRFAGVVDDERVAEAERSLREMLGVESLAGCRFLDVGSGSGLFSLAARRLGAERVHSFDADRVSVATTAELRRRRNSDDPAWTIEQGDILDTEFVTGLGRWDVVYAWGVLHHTGAMWRALEHTASTVDDGGTLFVSIYNDQGVRSALWRRVKRTYNRLPSFLRPLFTALVMGPRELGSFGKHVLRGKPLAYLRSWTHYARERGMSRWHDAIDWIGGYPFEVAKPEEVFDFLRQRGFRLERLVTCGGRLGCNQFVLTRADRPSSGVPN